MIKVGYARADITPDIPVPLGGYDNPENRMSSGVNHRIYATCIAFTDKNGNKTMKGNVDAELVLHAAAIEYKNYSKAVIVTSDGDFACLIKFGSG